MKRGELQKPRTKWWWMLQRLRLTPEGESSKLGLPNLIAQLVFFSRLTIGFVDTKSGTQTICLLVYVAPSTYVNISPISTLVVVVMLTKLAIFGAPHCSCIFIFNGDYTQKT